MNDSDLEARSEAAKALSEQIALLLSAVPATVSGLALADLVAAWLLGMSRGEPDRAARLFGEFGGYIERAVRGALEAGRQKPN